MELFSFKCEECENKVNRINKFSDLFFKKMNRIIRCGKCDTEYKVLKDKSILFYFIALIVDLLLAFLILFLCLFIALGLGGIFDILNINPLYAFSLLPLMLIFVLSLIICSAIGKFILLLLPLKKLKNSQTNTKTITK